MSKALNWLRRQRSGDTPTLEATRQAAQQEYDKALKEYLKLKKYEGVEIAVARGDLVREISEKQKQTRADQLKTKIGEHKTDLTVALRSKDARDNLVGEGKPFTQAEFNAIRKSKMLESTDTSSPEYNTQALETVTSVLKSEYNLALNEAVATEFCKEALRLTNSEALLNRKNNVLTRILNEWSNDPKKRMLIGVGLTAGSIALATRGWCDTLRSTLGNQSFYGLYWLGENY
ncbi:hypothetical protein HYT57_04670 [Candidatus Woesearchaeota archaeon]|nr:hypothetical protein [Candidatus Woesearchaeota archaeon]